MKNYQINYLTTNRFSVSKYYNIFAPNNKNKTNKINGSYYITYGNNINSPSKYIKETYINSINDWLWGNIFN